MKNAHPSRGDCGPLSPCGFWERGRVGFWRGNPEGAAQFQASAPVLALLKATCKFSGCCGMRRWTFSSDGLRLTGEEAREPCWQDGLLPTPPLGWSISPLLSPQHLSPGEMDYCWFCGSWR